VLTTEIAGVFTEMMAVIPYFPGEDGARTVISEEIAAMCDSEEQATWLVTRMVRLYRRWPSVVEMRIVFCSTYKPLDGVLPVGESEVYPDGIPSEHAESTLRLPGPRQDLLLSAAPSVDAMVRDLAEKTDMKHLAWRGQVRELPVVRITDANRITPEYVAQVEAEYRASLAAQKVKEEDQSDAG
jgi:hypothetical protein